TSVISTPRMAASVRMIIAGIEAMAHFTRINTIGQNGTLMSLMVTILEPLVMEVPLRSCSGIGGWSAALFDYRPSPPRGRRSLQPLDSGRSWMSLIADIDLKDLIRTIPDYPKPGIMFRDITTLLGHANGFRACVEQLARPFSNRRVQAVAGIEARGFILGGA